MSIRNQLLTFQHVFDAEFREPYKNLHRWFTTMINQPQVKAVIGDFQLCTKMVVFDNKRFSEMQAKLHGGDAKKSSKKAEKPMQEKKAAAPKEPKAAPEAEAPPAPKPKDPLDALPAGSVR